ncbi:autophagy protein 12 [Conidiobolus coronatus NRRL 28638]|uniref:Ubiquitin-like protein ATG12 n=1 Tax=Conidiobolus coronatus (strain ATCC 28846 / CBS 209.66 / NRRL 28638) TaxID=796925 RepID=A0A137P3Z5_CONC2|nr:autophagy protein 12 [Conidiobolus coronatus NRRL 28638]|eukprot:KXN69624.1 autophagy protein 12 [Conidiobolus coronatus NRRL 28638]
MSTQSRPNTPLDSSNRSSVSNTSFSSIDVNQFKRGDLPQKIIVRFRSVGNAPIMKQNLYKISTSNQFGSVANFLRKELRLKPSENLFLYINSAFCPNPDESVANLYKCFQTDGQLIVNYCSSMAWG